MGEAYLVQNFAPAAAGPFNLLTIPSTYIDENLTNFPMTVRLDTADANWAEIDGTSSNVYFTDMSDNQLDHEVELKDSTIAIYHVRIPSISSSANTQFKMKFDGSGFTNGHNPTAVWDSNYRGVWHLGNQTTKDSSGNGRTLSGINGTPTIGDGVFGKASVFNGGAAWGVTSSDLNPGATNVTLMMINKTTSISGGRSIASKTNQTASDYGVGLLFGYIDASIHRLYVGNTGTTWNSGSGKVLSTTISTNEFRQYVYRKSGTSYNTLQNATVLDSWSDPDIPANSSTPFVIGAWYPFGTGDTSYVHIGVIDEVRWSNIARSNAWLKAEYEFLMNDRLTIAAG